MASNISQLIKQAPVLAPGDTIRRAVGLIRASDSLKVLVAEDHQIMGAVSERAITQFLADSDDPRKAMGQPVGPLVESSPTFLNSLVSLEDAARAFAATGEDMLPVIDNYSAFRGVLYRRDVIGILTDNLRPPSVGGMATPLGVYLTTGSHTGGAGSIGLFLTGVSLTLMMIFSQIVVEGLPRLISAFTKFPIAVYLNSPPITSKYSVYDLLFYGSAAATMGLYMLILRLSPLAGYHAAEHMTVHAIEAGEELMPETVRPMPRVHPRCGTNLLAAATIFMLITSRLSSDFAVLFAIVVVILGWRSIGGWLQSAVTTKPPTEKQLKNGVAAGNELLAKFREQPNYQAYGFERVWRLGFIQTFLGMMSMGGVLWLIDKFVHLPAWLGLF